VPAKEGLIVKGGIKLFKIFGIPISLNYSWFIIFALIAWTLSTGYFPQVRPYLSTSTYWIAGLISTALLFVSVLIHELSHSLVALAHGLTIRGITLFIFGGVAQIAEEPEDAKTELKMAAAGPLTSFVLAIIFFGLSRLARAISPVSITATIFFYLFLINLILALFNLIPGFPLDGGRILRAYLWKKSGDQERATRTATNVGRWFGNILIFFGFVNLLWGRFLNGAWLILIGIFLRQAAAEAYQLANLLHLVAGVKVREAMNKNVVSIPSQLTLDYVVQDYFLRYRYSCFPVVAGGELIGTITVDDVKEVPRRLWGARTASEVMKTLPGELTVSPEDDVADSFKKMLYSRVKTIPVVDDGRLIGIITRGDILKLFYLKKNLE
jgi:Zn-dependent protease/predicted transcriptional regulator